MVNFRSLVNEVIQKADVLLLVLDARFIEESRNAFVEKRVRELGKPLIYVANKSDLVSLSSILKWQKHISPLVPFSAQKHMGTKVLRDQILVTAKKVKGKVKVGILGYPNVGKSSIINALKGKSSAPVSSVSGYTKSLRTVKVGSSIMVIDTPGIIPFSEKGADTLKLVLIGAIDFNQVREPDSVVLTILEKFPGRIEKYYEVPVENDHDITLETIARKKGLLKAGNIADILRVSKKILEDWQAGLI